MNQLPDKLKAFESAINKTKQKVIQINCKVQSTKITDSKFGGKPYWPMDQAYPLSENGEPLRLLAQINFEQIQTDHTMLPSAGILQFFVQNDDVYGLNFDKQTEQTSFRVIYHDTIVTDETKWLTNISHFSDEDYFPIEHECALQFETSEELISSSDYRFDELTNLKQLLDEEKYDEYDEMTEAYFDYSNGTGSKLGGYPFFTQEDPRANGDYTDFDTLLLQIDTDNRAGIMWGDSGVANFFISKKDLLQKNFSNILYNWDCY